MMQKVINKILEADSIVILAHDREDADAAGSSFAMRLALIAMGKKAVCCFSDRLEKHLEFMDSDYQVFSGSEIPVYDLCLCLDCGDMKRIGKRAAVFDAAAATASIDHHETNTLFAEENYVEADAPATGEILYRMFLKMGVEITEDIARNLYTAISSDTGSFKYSNVRPETMRIAGELLKKDFDHAEIARNLYDLEPLELLRFKGHVMNSIELYANGKLSIISISDGLLNEYGISEKDTGDIVNVARSVKGCEIAVSVRETKRKIEAGDPPCEREESLIKISFRSNGRYTVSDIAGKFGGGGHSMAAGASVSGAGLEEVRAQVIKICEEALNG